MMKTQTRPGYLSNILLSGATPFGQIGRGSGGDSRSETAGRMTSSSLESTREELITVLHSRPGAVTTADPVPDEIGESRADVLPGRSSNPPQTEKNRPGTTSQHVAGSAEYRRPEPPATESASPWTDRLQTISSTETAVRQTAIATSPASSGSSEFVPLEEGRSSHEPENERGLGLWPACGRQAGVSSSHAGATFSGLTAEMTVPSNQDRSETSGAGPEQSSSSGESLHALRQVGPARTPRLISAVDLPFTAPIPEMRAESGRNDPALPPPNPPDRPEESSHWGADRLPERSNALRGAAPGDAHNRAFNEAARHNAAAFRQEGGTKLTIQRLEVQIINQVSADRARNVSRTPPPDASETLERRHLGRML